MRCFIKRLARDESGGEALEYALLLGMLVVAVIFAVKSVGVKVLARWASIDASI